MRVHSIPADHYIEEGADGTHKWVQRQLQLRRSILETWLLLIRKIPSFSTNLISEVYIQLGHRVG